MQIVIPMAGKGRRFQTAGYLLPKPLIEVDGKPMIEHVTRLFSLHDDFVYVCSNDDLKTSPMLDVIHQVNPSGKIAGVMYSGKGPVFHTLKAARFIDDTKPTIVNYCDFSMAWNYAGFKKFVKTYDLDGCIVCYKGFHPHLLGPNLYASVRTDTKNNFLEIKEKYSFTEKKMDSWQSCGTYYFKSGRIMKKYFEKLIKEGVDLNGEYYVSLVYNLMHQDGLKIKVFPIDYFCQWGTPEDLAAYKYWSSIFNKS